MNFTEITSTTATPVKPLPPMGSIINETVNRGTRSLKFTDTGKVQLKTFNTRRLVASTSTRFIN